MIKNRLSYSKKLFITPLLLISSCLYANSAITIHDDEFTTDINFPDIELGKIFKPSYSNDHNLLFYTGEKDGHKVTGYFRAKHFLNWEELSFAPFDYYKDYGQGTLLDVATGAHKATVTLSTVEKLGQLLSTTSDGKFWYSQKINLKDKNFNKLTSISANAIEGVAAYGTDHTSFLTSLDNSTWQLWGFPDSCISEQECSIENKFFSSFYNSYVFIQTRVLDEVTSNKLYTTNNFTDWYHKKVPFYHDKIQKVLHDGHHDAIVVATITEDNLHKLWISEDLKNWESYKLPDGVTVSDAIVYQHNKIALLLVKKSEDGSISTDLAVIDSDYEEPQVLYTFNGEVSSLNFFDEKLYLSGSIFDINQKHSALISIVTE